MTNFLLGAATAILAVILFLAGALVGYKAGRPKDKP